MTWGGQWGDAMRDNVDAAYTKATGIKVVQDRGGSPVERITKLKVSQPTRPPTCSSSPTAWCRWRSSRAWRKS